MNWAAFQSEVESTNLNGHKNCHPKPDRSSIGMHRCIFEPWLELNNTWACMSQSSPSYKTISQLTQEIRDTLEGDFSRVTVSGEVSGFSPARSGHWYLSLKDEQSQISAVVWRNTAAQVRFPVEDGLQVVVRGRVSVYPPRGTYQLVIDDIQPLGEGSWRAAFRKLHQTLAGEGLFLPERKRTLPVFPGRVVVITSPTGAAIRDFLQVATRRWKACDVLILPTRVQGDGAGRQLAAAVELAARLRPAPDVIVLTRGGGSVEDLWEFNSEILVRAIAACPIPVVSGVGHEIDVTLCDLVADVRALTPSEAAERIYPDTQGLIQSLQRFQQRLAQGLTQRWQSARSQVDALANNRVLTRPAEHLLLQAQRLDELNSKLQAILQRQGQRRQDQMQALAARLESLSPLQVLSRGYSLTLTPDGVPLTDTTAIQVGDIIVSRLHRGTVVSQVREIQP